MVLHIEVCLPEETLTPKNIGGYLKGLQRKLWRETLFVKYDRKNVNLFSATIPIKSLPVATRVLCLLISQSIKQGDCHDARKFVA